MYLTACDQIERSKKRDKKELSRFFYKLDALLFGKHNFIDQEFVFFTKVNRCSPKCCQAKKNEVRKRRRFGMI